MIDKVGKTWSDISDAGDNLIEEGMMFLENMWHLLMSEWKAPRHLDKYMLGFMLVVALYVMGSCGKPAF